MEAQADQVASQAIITSLCWVSRGYAKATLEEYEPSKENLMSFGQFQAILKISPRAIQFLVCSLRCYLASIKSTLY